jgi:spore maturation protein CgeB
MAVSGLNPRAGGVEAVKQADLLVRDNAALARWYNGAAIALNHHRTCIAAGDELQHITDGAAWSLGPRAFEIAACGAFQLCDDTRPELTHVFGDSVATYHDAEELRDGIRHYMQHPDTRREMAAEALRRVSGCSFAARAESVLIPALQEAI